MSLLCACPSPTALVTIPAQTCPINILQVQKAAFQRSGWVWDGTTGKDITLAADWTALKAATDDTKVVVTPYIYEVAITPGEAITIGGGDNTTLNGVPQLTGINPTTVVMKLRQASAAVIAAIKALMCEQGLVAYFFNEAGQIICLKIGSTTTYKGLTAQTFFCGDTSNEGFGTLDNNMISFSIPQGWSASMAVITPAFNPLTTL